MGFVRRHKILSAVIVVIIVAVGVAGLVAVRFITNTANIAPVVSKETTYITEPLRPDGYPDYVAAMNQRMSEGITPENNAAVLFWQAVDPRPIREKYREEFFRMLGVPPPAERGKYFVDLFAYPPWRQDELRRRKAGEKARSDEAALSPLLLRPWSKEDFPIIAAWLAANERPLELLVQASKRPRRYDPLIVPKGETMNHKTIAYVNRRVYWALLARAMLRLHEAKVDDAWQDLLACRRLARLTSQSRIRRRDTQVAMFMEQFAIEGNYVLLQNAKLTTRQITGMRNDLARLPPTGSTAVRVDFGDRCACLDGMLWLSRQGPATIRDYAAPKTTPRLAAIAGIDWNVALRVVNAWFDRQSAALRKPSFAKQQAAESQVCDDLYNEGMAARSWKTNLSAMANPREVRSKAVGLMFVECSAVAVALTKSENRFEMQRDLNEVAFALAAYRIEHGAYPARLDDLKPVYLKEVPKDIFAGDADLHYALQNGGYLLYSVGPNGKDDGGRGRDDAKNGEGWDDLAVRMTAGKP